MSTGEPTNGANTVQDVSHWLTAEEAAARLKLSAATIRRRAAKGALKSQWLAGVQRFDPDGVDELGDREGSTLATADVIQVLTGTIRQQQQHNERLLELAAGSSFKTHELLANFAGRQADLIAKQQTQIEAMRASHEAALNEHHMRELKGREQQAAIDIARRESEAKEKHYQQALDLAKTNVPALLALVGSKVSPGDPTPAAAGVLALFDSLTPTQLESIRGTLTREQLTSLFALFDARKRSKVNLEKAEVQAQQDAVAGAGGSSPVGAAGASSTPAPPAGGDEQSAKLYAALVETQAAAEKAMGVVRPLLEALATMTEGQRAELIDLIPSDKRPGVLDGLKGFF